MGGPFREREPPGQALHRLFLVLKLGPGTAEVPGKRPEFRWNGPVGLYRTASAPDNRGVPASSRRVLAMLLRFGDFTLDRDRRLLERAGENVPLTRKAFDLLELLVLERPRAVSKEGIRDHVWPKTVVSESTLNSLVAEVRTALGDAAQATRFVRTVHGFGYAFEAEVVEVARPGSSQAPPARIPARLLWGERLIQLSPGENVLGRDDDVGVRIDAPSVSRRHAKVTVAAGEPATLEDLGSKNGTWLAGQRLAAGAVPLSNGDQLRLGRVELVFLDSKQQGSTQTVVD